MVAHNTGRERRSLWYHSSPWLVFSAGIFPVHSRPLTAESAPAAASAVKPLQWEGDKVKDLLEGQCQETTETSHDRGCALCSSGTIYLQARLHQTPPRAVLASYLNYLTHLQEEVIIEIVNTYPTPARQTDSLPKWSSSASQNIKYCTFLVETGIAKPSETAAVPVNCSFSWHSTIVERASRIYVLPPPGAQIISEE